MEHTHYRGTPLLEIVRQRDALERDRAELIEVLGKTAGALDAALNSGGDWTIDADEALSEVRALLSRLEQT